jgi:hypothetical protein
MNTLERDAELVGQVKFVCDRAKGSAEKLAAATVADWRFESNKDSYLQSKLMVLRITNRITDRFYFETAINALITLCITAKEIDDARRLFGALTIDDIREAVLRAHPELGTPAQAG